MKKLTLNLVALLAAGTALAGTAPAPAPLPPPPPASGSLLNYNGLELGWLHTEWDSSFLDSSDGAYGSLTWSPFEHLYLTAGGAWESVDTSWDSSDLWLANVGVGGYLSLTSNIDFVTEAGVLFYGVDNSPLGDDNDANIYVRPHFRGRWGRFETHLGATWSNIDDITNEWSGFARFYFEVWENLDVVGGISAGTEEYTINAGIRLRY
ncbi:MAG: hypothetical protein KA004_09370 [Verrucomicrobiales bacterium]|nr:hypothetical protein [Verrucomicrobiales bacterium]